MQEEESTIDKVEGVSGQTGFAGAGLTERDVVETVCVAKTAGLFELVGAEVNADDRAGRADNFGEHARCHAYAAPEVGDGHSWFDARLQEESTTGGRVNVVESGEATYGGRSGCQRI